MFDLFICVMILFQFSPIPSRSVPEPTIQIISFLKIYPIIKKWEICFVFNLMTALPVHCPSITSIQGPSVLSSEKNNQKFWIYFLVFIKCEIFGLYPFCNCLLYKGFLVDRAPLSYFCCPSGHTQYPTAEEHFYGNIHCRKTHKNISGHTQYPSAQEEYNNIAMETYI